VNVTEFACDRGDECEATKPPRANACKAGPTMKGGVFNEGTDKWLTVDLRRRKYLNGSFVEFTVIFQAVAKFSLPQ